MNVAEAIAWVGVGVILSAVAWQFHYIVFPVWHENWARKHGWIKPEECPNA